MTSCHMSHDIVWLIGVWQWPTKFVQTIAAEGAMYMEPTGFPSTDGFSSLSVVQKQFQGI
jgi:hypothetical protein